MSFLRPTESSLRRAHSTLEEQHRRTSSPIPPTPSTAAAGAVQPLSARPTLTDAPVPDYSHAASGADLGLHSRVQTSSLSGCRLRSQAQTDFSACSPSLHDFNNKCDIVIQRAQELLGRTREQELLVAKALEGRLAQSPTRRGGTPSPPLSQSVTNISPFSQQMMQQQQQTPARWFSGFTLSSSGVSPAVPAAPHTTPVAQPHNTSAEDIAIDGGSSVLTRPPKSPSSSHHGLDEWLGLRAPSPSLPPLPAPPPTPTGPQRGSTIATPSGATSTSTTVVMGSVSTPDGSGSLSPSSPSFLQRIRRSLQRTLLASVETSPPPLPPGVAPPVGALQVHNMNDPSVIDNGSCPSGQTLRASPRKSVKFMSPDKLESVTPTKVVVFRYSDSSGSEEDDYKVDEDEETSSEESEEAAQPSVQQQHPVSPLPPSKRARLETPKRDSVVFPPAPPPSTVKNSHFKQRERAGGRAPSPSSSSQRTRSLSVSLTSSPPPLPPQRSSPSMSSDSLRSTTTRSPSSASVSSADGDHPSRTFTVHHDELKAYVMQHTIRQCLSHFSKKEMKAFLKEEGSSLARQHHVLKKKLLTEIRALIKKQGEA